MDDVRFSNEFGKEIFVLNFDYNDYEEAYSVIAECARLVRKRPEKSVLTLTLVSSGMFTAQLVDKLKELTKGNEPYVRKAAVVGITGIYKIAMTAVSIFSKRDFKVCDTKEEAIAYLLKD
jgi:hypothetical protein